MGNPISKYERIELLVCIYEISRELVFNYGISECSRRLTLVTTVNPIPSQVQFEKTHLPVELWESVTFRAKHITFPQFYWHWDDVKNWRTSIEDIFATEN